MIALRAAQKTAAITIYSKVLSRAVSSTNCAEHQDSQPLQASVAMRMIDGGQSTKNAGSRCRCHEAGATEKTDSRVAVTAKPAKAP